MGAPAVLRAEAPRRGHLTRDVGGPAALLGLAAGAWWYAARTAAGMRDTMAGPLALGAFLLAWVAMMAAMMFPAITPVVRLYGRAASAGRVAPLPFFVAGYLAVWSSIGLPVYAGWRALAEPLADARPWAARLAGGVLAGAAIWQLTPLKQACLRHCRSPMSLFLRSRARLERPAGALRAGTTHGLSCVGCCWALMAVLVALGTMNLAWMAGLAVLILVEKTTPFGARAAPLAAIAFAAAGGLLLARPDTLTIVASFT